MKNIWILARMTFREAGRRRIVLTGMLLGICFLLVYSIGFHLIFTQARQVESTTKTDPGQQHLVRIADVEGMNMLVLAGLYAVTFMSIALGALLGADTLAGEIASGAIQTLAAKPIRRSDIVLGKWLGYAILLAFYSLLMSGGVVLSVFSQTGYLPPHLWAGLPLIYLESLMIMTIAIACSSFLPGLASGGVVFGLYGLAFIGGWIEQFGSILHNATAIKVGIVSSLIIPSEAMWRRAAFEMQTPLAGVLNFSPFGTISVPSTLMILYAVIYLAAALALAVYTFQHRDL